MGVSSSAAQAEVEPNVAVGVAGARLVVGRVLVVARASVVAAHRRSVATISGASVASVSSLVTVLVALCVAALALSVGHAGAEHLWVGADDIEYN